MNGGPVKPRHVSAMALLQHRGTQLGAQVTRVAPDRFHGTLYLLQMPEMVDHSVDDNNILPYGYGSKIPGT